MSAPIQGKLELKNTGGTATSIVLDGDSGDIHVGGGGQTGDLLLLGPTNKEQARVGRIPKVVAHAGQLSPNVPEYVGLRVADETGDPIVQLGRLSLAQAGGQAKPQTVSLILGGGKAAGKVGLVNNVQQETIEIDGQQTELMLKTGGKELIALRAMLTTQPLAPGMPAHPEVGGSVIVNNAQGEPRILLDGSVADVRVGGAGRGGDVAVLAGDGKQTIHLGGQQAKVGLLNPSGKFAVELNANPGSLLLSNSSGEESIRLETVSPQGGRMFIRDANGKNSIKLDGPGGQILIRDADNKTSITLDGLKGDIILSNADCAEDFDTAGDALEPGTVVVMDSYGKLRRSESAYDRKVAGVISGAGGFKPALVLDRTTVRPGRAPVALVGKVYCKVDAQYSQIETGDLLTTSPTPGHAMKAADPAQAFGAVIGKAMSPLERGCGLIAMLIALQ